MSERMTPEQHGGHGEACPIMRTGSCDCRPHPSNDLKDEARRNNEARWRSTAEGFPVTAPDPRLDEIQARLDAATPGPWEWDDRVRRALTGRDGAGVLKCAAVLWPDPPDAEFIAMAPGDVSFLLAELRKAHEALERVEALADKYKRYGFPYKAEEIRAAVAAAKGDERG